MLRVEKRTTQKSGIACSWERFFEIDSLPVLLRDNGKNNHFYIQQIKLCSNNMANVWKDPNLAIKASFAKVNAWREFVGHFPKADRSRFIAQGSTDGKNVTEEIFFKEGPGSLQSVFG